MTREEAFESNSVGNFTEDDMVWLRDMIYDDFESRTCENCKCMDDISLANNNSYLLCRNDNVDPKSETYRRVELDFGCNKFQRKEHE